MVYNLRCYSTLCGEFMGNVAVIGMVGNSAFLSVDHFHRPGETVAAKAIHFEPGGKGFNQAVAAARFGATVSFLGAVGTQCYDEIKAFLEKDGITPVLPRKKEPTAYAAILTDAAGANQVTVYQGARLTAQDVLDYEPYIARADVLLLNNEVPAEVNLFAAKLAKKYNTYVICNPAPRIALDEAFVELVDLFTPNEHEAEGLEQVQNKIITLGSEGCYIKESGITLPALQIANVVDTTGAGDTFNGVLASQLSCGRPVEKAVISAVCASGVSVTRKYAATAIPTANEVTRYMKENG